MGNIDMTIRLGFFFLVASLHTGIMAGSEPSQDVLTQGKSSGDQCILWMDEGQCETIIASRPERVSWEVNLRDVGMIRLEWHHFCNVADGFAISRSTEVGTIEEHYAPRIATYELSSVTDSRGNSYARTRNFGNVQWTCRGYIVGRREAVGNPTPSP
jgi:hypothetical protein